VGVAWGGGGGGAAGAAPPPEVLYELWDAKNGNIISA
jgi:hypothetical protein